MQGRHEERESIACANCKKYNKTPDLQHLCLHYPKIVLYYCIGMIYLKIIRNKIKTDLF